MSWYEGFEHIVREDEPLGTYTWFRLGGAAEFFAEPNSVDELAQLLQRCDQHDMPFRVIGGGSRVLISDAGVKGLVVHLSAPAFCETSVEGSYITAGGGAKLGHVVSLSVGVSLGGLESLVGVPGTVAGALKGNADSYGASIGQWTESVKVMSRSGAITEYDRDQLRFSYRQSSLDDPVILSARFELEPRDPNELTRRMQKLWIIKRSQQPSGSEGSGRIFADPQGISAAELIEQVGLRSLNVGGAELSEKNANYVVIHSGAKTDDVRMLIEQVKNKVASELGVDLQCELQIW